MIASVKYIPTRNAKKDSMMYFIGYFKSLMQRMLFDMNSVSAKIDPTVSHKSPCFNKNSPIDISSSENIITDPSTLKNNSDLTYSIGYLVFFLVYVMKPCNANTIAINKFNNHRNKYSSSFLMTYIATEYIVADKAARVRQINKTIDTNQVALFFINQI